MTESTWRDGFTSGQVAALLSVVDGLLPPIKAPKETKDAVIIEYWQYQLSQDEDFMEVIATVVLKKLTPTQRLLMLGVLTCLSSIPGTILLVGSMDGRSFVEWPLEERVSGLLRMQHSTLLQRRQAYQSLKRLVFNLAFTYQKKNGKDNPFCKALGYQTPSLKTPAKDLVSPDVPLLWDLKVDEMEQENGKLSIHCDIVVVGSGAGGGVAAKILSEAGYDVVVLEKGPYVSPDKLSLSEGKAFDELYDGHGLVTSLDGNFAIISGSTLGGGTAVNWSCCLPLPASVRQEWVQKHNLGQFSPHGEFDDALKAVYEAMEVTTDPKAIQHNKNNQKFQEGCDRMGFKWKCTGQNVDTTDEASGNLPFGDRSGLKRDGRVVYLQAAVKNGTRILDRCEALSINKVYSSETRSFKARGVLCKRGHQLIEVNARRAVIVAAGSLWSPCLLRRSGFKNKHIGQHLRLHPATGVSGRLPEPVDCFKGAPMTTVCTEFEDLNNGYGAKIECPCLHPGLAASAAHCPDPSLFKRYMLDYRNAVSLIVLQRDSSEGKVLLGFDGFPIVDYKLNENDKKSMMAAMKGGVEILLACGAEECGTTHIGDLGIKANKLKPFDKADNNSTYREGLEQISKRGLNECEATMFSAHQMGTCRMSSSSATGVVDCNGETWECDDLLVVDASVFPTATAVNPMMTVLAMSEMLCQRFAQRLKNEDQREELEAEVKAMREQRQSRRPSWLLVPSGAASLMVSQSSLRLLVQASAPVVALFWFYYQHKPLLLTGIHGSK
ncbi:chain-alcohol oxidase FAO1 [Seminavis robusta]|uniref:Long-chain-alcohol oxidase n=1 Tax=Seminavis robusta TaxID=568900 RepID=A0A9N8EA96_9STRA|nr:chain-alcohol oxidase FAO1 [Seminavis robusta]|eukprot:Sro799_g204110.1 chain-alcohol oxidase FAO1 (777) ;mRNA; r:21818-24326